MKIAWRSVVDGCVLICLLCRVFFKVRANRRVGKSKDPKNRVPEIAVPDLVSLEHSTRFDCFSNLHHFYVAEFLSAPSPFSALVPTGFLLGIVGTASPTPSDVARDVAKPLRVPTAIPKPW